MTSQHKEIYDSTFEEQMLRLAKENNKLLQALNEQLHKIFTKYKQNV
jgi:hypothetical protein